MISGILGISIAFIAATVSAAAYWLYYRDKEEHFYNLANRAFAISGAAILFAVVLLYYNIFIHNFQLNYVYSYTSLKLSTYYLISTFWAGQEGTFLLWLLFSTVFGIILIRTLARKEPMAMSCLMMVQSFILLILLKKSPFAMIWHAHAEAPVGFMPADGASLNPLLQNPWMIIHPPIMFVGYSSTVVAFALALNGMVKRDFMRWVKQARPWVVFTVLTLGAGIIMGGYWSYVTLGWGGYWAWDPVENASLVPWLFTAVLLHGLIIQSRQKGLVKTNLFLAGLAFISVLWGSFLTRSGVLSDFSVHSFAESDLNLYLMAFVSLFSGIFLYYFFKSVGKIESPRFAEGIFSRETFILLGMMSLLFTGITVFMGTSSPIYTGLFGKPSNVSTGFYNTISIPIAIFMLLSMGIAPLLIWKVSELRDKKTLGIGTVAAVVVTLMAVIFGLTKPTSIILVLLSVLVITTNGYVAFKILKKKPAKTGSYLSHVGIALMIIGIITSSMYSKSEKVTLPAGDFEQTDFGYNMKFVDFMSRPDGKDRARIIVEKDNASYEADPQFYYSEYTKSYMLSPHVKVGIARDIYISPISFMPARHSNTEHLELVKNQSQDVKDVNITFNKFIVGDHTELSPMMVRADLTVKLNQGGYDQDYPVQPALWMENGKMKSNEVDIPGTGYKIQLESLDANEGKIALTIYGGETVQEKPQDILAVEVSEKPFISILWFGSIILVGGVFLSLLERIKQS